MCGSEHILRSVLDFKTEQGREPFAVCPHAIAVFTGNSAPAQAIRPSDPFQDSVENSDRFRDV